MPEDDVYDLVPLEETGSEQPKSSVDAGEVLPERARPRWTPRTLGEAIRSGLDELKTHWHETLKLSNEQCAPTLHMLLRVRYDRAQLEGQSSLSGEQKEFLKNKEVQEILHELHKLHGYLKTNSRPFMDYS